MPSRCNFCWGNYATFPVFWKKRRYWPPKTVILTPCKYLLQRTDSYWQFYRFFLNVSPWCSIWCDVWTSLSSIASATLLSVITSNQLAWGSWLVIMVDAFPWRSSINWSRSNYCCWSILAWLLGMPIHDWPWCRYWRIATEENLQSAYPKFHWTNGTRPLMNQRSLMQLWTDCQPPPIKSNWKAPPKGERKSNKVK